MIILVVMLRGKEWRDIKFHGADSSTNIVCRFNSIFLCTFFIHLLLLKDISLGIAYSSARVYLQIQINGQVSFFVKWTTLNLDHKQQWRWKRSPFKAHLSIEKEWSAHHRDFCDFITVIFVPLLFLLRVKFRFLQKIPSKSATGRKNPHADSLEI